MGISNGLKITSAKFIKGIVRDDEALKDGIPQVAFIGRSNVGKSSTINALTRQKDLARTSRTPGRTQEINLFLINDSFYLVDLPGYGYSSGSKESKEALFELVNWYLFTSGYEQKMIVLIIDANIGATEKDLEILQVLDEHKKNIIIAANKIDKINKSDYQKQLQKIQEAVGDHKVIPYSSKKGIGINDLTKEIMK
ncbi:MAG: ribosome biogenesis GTP-binding protein YihA/YsxC [bacterium]|nr:ribosome biogenesis GTP-binding protein YihA/YsxC [bacterium]